MQKITKENIQDYALKLMFKMKDDEFDAFEKEFETILKQHNDIIFIVPNDVEYYDSKFIARRQTISSWINKLFNPIPHEIITNNNIDESAFKTLDRKLLQGIIDFICSMNNIIELNNVRIQDYNKLLQYISSQNSDYESLKCYPDFDGNFHTLNELYDSRNIPDLFFDEKYHIRSKLLHPNITIHKNIITTQQLQFILDNDSSIKESDLLSIRSKNEIQRKMCEIYKPNNIYDQWYDDRQNHTFLVHVLIVDY